MLISAVIHICMYIYIYSLFITVYYKILNIISCAMQISSSRSNFCSILSLFHYYCKQFKYMETQTQINFSKFTMLGLLVILGLELSSF